MPVLVCKHKTRTPVAQALKPKEHVLHIFHQFHLTVSDSGGEQPTSSACCDLIVEADTLHTPGSTASFFAPPSLPAILRFCDSLERALAANPSRRVALRLPAGDPAALAAGVFLAGAYMLLRIGLAPDEVAPRFAPLAPLLRQSMSSAEQQGTAATSPAPPAPPAPLQCTPADCWAGLWKAHRLGWLAPIAAGPGLPGPDPSGEDGGDSDGCGGPFRPDIQVLVPGRLVVFRGPKGLPGGLPWRDVVSGDGRPVGREFAPAGLVPALRRAGVEAVVRLNAAEYPADAFPAAGLGFADLHIPEGGTPPPAVAAKFLRILDAVPGAVAVHGGAGLGRAGALAALYAMRRHGFSAREAAGWLGAVRPGSVGPEQLAYLVGREAVLLRVAADAAGDPEAGSASPSSRIGLMLGRRANGPHGEPGLLSPLRRRSLAPLAALAAGRGHSSGHGDSGAVAADDDGRAARLIAAALAEVDSRLQALDPGGSGGGSARTSCSCPRPRPASQPASRLGMCHGGRVVGARASS